MNELKDLYMRVTNFSCGPTMTDPLTIEFDIPFDDGTGTNNAEIKVYNLQDSTINSIKNKTPAVLTAGYKTDSGVIFQGVLKEKKSGWQDVNKITTFTCIDTTPEFLEKTFKKQYAKNTTASTIITDVIGFAGLQIGDMDLPVDFVYRTGKTVDGKPKKILAALAKDCKAKMHVTQNKVYIREKNKPTAMVVTVNKDTGLIGEPEEISNDVEDAQTKEKVKRVGYKVTTLLNHRVKTDVIISLSSRKVSGSFRVEKGKHINNGTSYYTEMEVYPL